MPIRGDKFKQTSFDFAECSPAKPTALPSSQPSMGKRAKQRDRGRAKEAARKSNHNERIVDSSPIEKSPQISNYRQWPKTFLTASTITLALTIVALYCAPQQIDDATAWYRDRFSPSSKAHSGKDTTQQTTIAAEQESQITTGAISGAPIREKTISAAVALLGTGSFENQTKKFVAHLKRQTIEEPGLKGIIESAPELSEDLKRWCVTVRSPTKEEAQIRACSADALAAYRRGDCVSVTGFFEDFPPSQRLLVNAIIRSQEGGCSSLRKNEKSRLPDKQTKPIDNRSILERLFQ